MELSTFSKLEKSNFLHLNHVDVDDACRPKGAILASAKYTLRFNKGGFACVVDLRYWSFPKICVMSVCFEHILNRHFMLGPFLLHETHRVLSSFSQKLLRDRKDNKITVADIPFYTIRPLVEGQIQWLCFVICSNSSI